MGKIRFITKEQLLEMMENREKFKLVEVLSRDSYNEEHLPGALSLPVDEIEKNASGLLSKNDIVVVYCGSYVCHASINSARKLMAMGYKKVLDYKGGKQDWKHSGLEMEK